MQYSMEMLTVFVFDRKYPLRANLAPIFKIVCLKLNLVSKLIRICRIPWNCPLFHFWSKIPFLGKFCLKFQNCLCKVKFGNQSNSNMQNAMVIQFFRFWPKMPYLGKFGQKNKNFLFKLKFGTSINSNMPNPIVMFFFSCFWRKIPVLGKFGPKI